MQNWRSRGRRGCDERRLHPARFALRAQMSPPVPIARSRWCRCRERRFLSTAPLTTRVFCCGCSRFSRRWSVTSFVCLDVSDEEEASHLVPSHSSIPRRNSIVKIRRKWFGRDEGSAFGTSGPDADRHTNIDAYFADASLLSSSHSFRDVIARRSRSQIGARPRYDGSDSTNAFEMYGAILRAGDRRSHSHARSEVDFRSLSFPDSPYGVTGRRKFLIPSFHRSYFKLYSLERFLSPSR